MMDSNFTSHLFFPESMLAFSSEESHFDIHPLKGLVKYGAYSSNITPGPIQVATIAPRRDAEKLYEFMKELRKQCVPTERKDYLPDWPGFLSVFHVDIKGAGGDRHITIDEDFDRELIQSPNPHQLLYERLSKALQTLYANRHAFQVIFIFLPKRWETAFYGATIADFDLHDQLKAITAKMAIPIQLVREDRAITYPNRAGVMWHIGLAIYAKAGGVPWKLANTNPDHAYIGISYAIKKTDQEQPQFVTCCSQIFDADGAGLEFIAYDTREVCHIHKMNPFLTQNEMFRVMSRSLDLYQRRHAGKIPRHITVHKSTEFRKEEIEGCMEAFHLCESVNLVQVVQDVGWRGVRMNQGQGGNKMDAAWFPVQRGSLVSLDKRNCLLWVHGDVKGVGKKESYYQGARSTPYPIKLVRFAGHGPWHETAQGILALSKMNWNNDALYDQLPVTVSYAQVLARVIKRMDNLGSKPYQYRFFM